MSNHYIDYKNTDVFLAIGANPAEAHPQAMKWIGIAMATRGAKLIVADPRLTKTASHAHVFAQFRPGTDIPFLMGIINYAIENDLYFKDYIVLYTNASYLVNPDYKFNDGLFSGATEKDGNFSYDRSTWQYDSDGGTVKKDLTLQDPNCVFQHLKKHVARYDIKTVSDITGVPQDIYRQVCETFCSTGVPNRVGNILYAMGVTQHTVGTQNTRAIAMVQLMMGNVGMPGGGVNAQRGECNVQGSTDSAMLFHLIPGYVGVPNARLHANLTEYNEKETPSAGFWQNKPKFLASMLKAFYGDNATLENDLCFDWLPKVDGKNRSHMKCFEMMYDGQIQGLFAWGQNPAVCSPDTLMTRKAMEKLSWMVTVDLFLTETADFWRGPGVNPADVQTECFFLPAAYSFEKDGNFTNSGRWIQWHYKAIDPPGEAKRDLWIANELFKTVRKEYQASGGAFPDAILGMNWDYDGPGGEPDIEKVCREMNGYRVDTGELLTTFVHLADDGSTACGNWIYGGYFATDPELGVPNCKRRSLQDPSGLGLFPKFSYCWPINRRIVYNRCSTDANGNPWDPQRAAHKWDGEKWVNFDVPDFNATLEPQVSATNPFIMLPEGQARLFAPTLVDGPFPEHYEPIESPTKNVVSSQQNNPCAVILQGEWKKLAAVGDPEYPIVATNHRLVEHYQSGGITRHCPTLAEIAPWMHINISPELAAAKGIQPGDEVIVESKRGSIKCKASVLATMKPLIINGQKVDVISMPWHYGFKGYATGATANDLTPTVGDPSVSIPEFKAFLCNIKKA